MSELPKKWKMATVYDGQSELSERERYYMDGSVEACFEVRYDHKHVYNSEDGEFIISIMRVNLQPAKRSE
jgi:hypothetical protein